MVVVGYVVLDMRREWPFLAHTSEESEFPSTHYNKYFLVSKMAEEDLHVPQSVKVNVRLVGLF